VSARSPVDLGARGWASGDVFDFMQGRYGRRSLFCDFARFGRHEFRRITESFIVETRISMPAWPRFSCEPPCFLGKANIMSTNAACALMWPPTFSPRRSSLAEEIRAASPSASSRGKRALRALSFVNTGRGRGRGLDRRGFLRAHTDTSRVTH
jgi:hypothetical protein